MILSLIVKLETLLIGVGIFCFLFASRMHKRFPVFSLWPEESKLSVWEMLAWPYSLSFPSWKMNTKKSTTAYNNSSQAKQASSIPFARADLWWHSEDHITDVVMHHMFLPRQLEAMWRAYFPLCLVCILVLTGPPLLHLCGAAPQTLVLAGRLSRLAGNHLSPKAKFEEMYTTHQKEPRNALRVVRPVKRLWEPWGFVGPRTHPDAEAGRQQACSSGLCRMAPSLGNAPPVRGEQGWKGYHCQGILSWKTQMLC